VSKGQSNSRQHSKALSLDDLFHIFEENYTAITFGNVTSSYQDDTGFLH
jgi:hypothetical protein